MAEDTSTFDADYRALRSAGGAVALSDWCSITFKGRDRQAFLNNFCTNDVKRLTAGTGCEAFITDVKGKTIGHGFVSCRDEELVFVGAPGQGQRLADHFDRYIIREDVVTRETTSERDFYLIAGESPLDIATSDAPTQAELPWRLIGSPYERVIEAPAAERKNLQARLIESGIRDCDVASFDAARLEAGTPLIGVDFNEANLPQEVARDQEAISFTKGCYLGQETVARIDALGHVNRHLVVLQFDQRTIPDVGTEVHHNDRLVGRVTSAAYSPLLGAPIALAMIRREAATSGTVLQSLAGPATVIDPPLRQE